MRDVSDWLQTERQIPFRVGRRRRRAAVVHLYTKTGAAPDRVIAAYDRARELGEWSPTLDVELATLLLAQGDRERAEPLLVAVAADVHGGETADEARRLLDSIRSEAPGE